MSHSLCQVSPVGSTNNIAVSKSNCMKTRSSSGSMRVNPGQLSLNSCRKGCNIPTTRLIMIKCPPPLINRQLNNSWLSLGFSTSQRTVLLRCQRKEDTMSVTKKDEAGMEKQEKGFETRKLSALSSRGERFKNEFLKMIVPWDKLPEISLDAFPYYIAERLVSGIAREFQVPLLKLDSRSFPPYEIGNERKDDESDDYEEEKESRDHDSDEEDDTDIQPLKKGDTVGQSEATTCIKELNNRTLSKGQRGELSEVKGDKIAVVFHVNGLAREEAERDEKTTDKSTKAFITWLDAKHIKRDRQYNIHDCYIAMEVLCEVLESQQPIVVYCSNCFSIPWDYSDRFLNKIMRKMFDQLSGRVVLFYGLNQMEAENQEIQKFPDSLKKYIESLKDPAWYEEYIIDRIFTNVAYIKLPKDQKLLNTLAKQIEEDRTTVISQGNISEMNWVLKKHGLLTMNFEQPKIDDMILTREKAEKVVGWATNHYISSCSVPCVKDDRLHISHEGLKHAILRLKEQEKETKKLASKSFKDLARGNFEEQFISAVVEPGDLSIKFDDVGALEDVKKTLNELIILPMKRPELSNHGNLMRPCKGMLLFGPPGTGKTLIAKALAKEAGAHFINVTPASLGSKWYGDTENLARALFTYARKLTPTIIFMDEPPATRSMRNEIMAGWDGLMSKENERIIVIGTTNRPFDIDDAVIHRMPRRICVGLPDVASRCKILKVLLAKEKLESGFCFEQVTEGYSGSDLKNLCVAAAYMRVQEILDKESKGEICDGVAAIRALNVNDFIHSKTMVGASVAYDSRSIMKLREWNEQYGQGGRSQLIGPLSKF